LATNPRKVLWLGVAVPSLALLGATPDLVQNLQSGTLPQRRQAAQELGRQSNDPRAGEALAGALKDKDPYVRTLAIRGLAKLRWTAAGPTLEDVLIRDASPDVRQTAALAIPILDSVKGSEALVQALADPSEAVRATAVGSLGTLKIAAAVPRLLDLAHDPSALVRHRLAGVLGTIGAPSAIPALTLMMQDADAGVRGTAALALGDMHAHEAVAALQPLLKDDDRLTRVAAACALAQLGDASGRDVAIDSLHDPDHGARLLGIETIGWIGDPTLASMLRPMAAEKDFYIREAAEKALKQLSTGKR